MDNKDLFILLSDIIKKLDIIFNFLSNNTKISIILQEIRNIIKIMNNAINENRNNNEQIKEKIKNLQNDMINKLQNLNNNNNYIKKTKIYGNGKYYGEIRNDIREGKGIMYYIDGDRYEGKWKNDKAEGKGIYFYNNGDIKCRIFQK